MDFNRNYPKKLKSLMHLKCKVENRQSVKIMRNCSKLGLIESESLFRIRTLIFK